MVHTEEKKRDKDKFRFKQFTIKQDKCSMKVGTDGILLGAWVKVQSTNNILDIGAGTGLIALMCAQRSNAEIHAVEIENQSFKQAVENVKSSPWAERVKVLNVSIQDFARDYQDTYDLIISNPPFFTGGTFSINENRNNVRHTVKLPTGDLLAAARKLLSKDGRLCIILPMIEGLRFKERALTYGLYCTEILEVFPKDGKKANRLLMQFEKLEGTLLESSLTVRTKDGAYTSDFIDLTKFFYLFM